MSGRIHDLVTAENFAKWAEGQVVFGADGCGIPSACVVAQFLRSLGFQGVAVVPGHWIRLNGKMTQEYEVPKWIGAVAWAYDQGELCGPALARIALATAPGEPR